MNDTKTYENIAETLARVLPVAQVVHRQLDADDLPAIVHVAVPKGFDLKSIDDEALLFHPRRTKAVAVLVEPESFLAYAAHHHDAEATAVWCYFNPATYALAFHAVIDDHSPRQPGWRQHRATFEPRMSVEWDTWLKHSGKPMGQLEFAEFLEAHEKDIAAQEGVFPSSLDMMKMATAFEANADKRFKSKIRTASGGVELAYVNTDDEATVDRMKLFEKFQIGIPVFWSMPGDAPVVGWRIQARLKYRVNAEKVTFYYELIRPDLVHERAAVTLIDQIRAGLGSVPLRMGSCS